MVAESRASAQEIEDLIRARYILIYVVSAEERRVEDALVEIGKNRNRKVLTWTCTTGLEAVDSSESFTDIRDPLRALDFIANEMSGTHPLGVVKDTSEL